MQSLYDYLLGVFEEEGAGAATPANTVGMGDPGLGELISAPEGGIPRGETRLFHKKKRRKKKGRDFEMTSDKHDV